VKAISIFLRKRHNASYDRDAATPISQRNRLSFGRRSGIKTDCNSGNIGTLRWLFWSRILLRICSIDELVDYKRTPDLLGSRIFGIDKWISVFSDPEMRNTDILLIIDGYKSGFNCIAALIFLNGIGVILFSEHSYHLLQIFDVIVATPLKRAFIFELDQRISWFTNANPREQDKAQIIRWI
jgi:hypothetical protein